MDLAAWAVFALTVSASLLILAYYHNRFWLPPDDGYFAHVAERLLEGELLHRDIQALHTGAIYYLNALAMHVFGGDLMSLRYPLIAAGAIQVVPLFFILAPRGLAIATAGGLLVTASSIVQFFSPTAHWYCPSLFFVLVLLLDPARRNLRWRLEAIGFLLITMFLFRQLTAVFVAMGAVTYLFLESRPSVGAGRLVARATIFVMAVGLAAYLFSKTDVVGWMIFGLWPLLAMLWTLRHVQVDDRQAIQLILRLSVGAALAASPLLLHHLLNGTLGHWFSDVFVDAIALGEFEYQKAARYGLFLLASAAHLIAPPSAGAFINGAYWLVLILSAAFLGSALLARLHASRADQRSIAPLPFLATFYGLVALHYQEPAYLYFAAGPVFAGILWYAGDIKRPSRTAVSMGACFFAIAALYYHAGQPISRNYKEILTGERQDLVKSSLPALAGLHVTRSDEETYTQLLAIIGRHSSPEDPILGVPAQSELFFLTGRRNPLRYSFLPFGVRDDETVDQALQALRATPPRLVFHVPDLPYNTEHTDEIMGWVVKNYLYLRRIREFDVYVLPIDGYRKPST